MSPALSCLLLVALVAPTDDPPLLKQARQRWLKGNYDEARDLYERVPKNYPAFKPRAAIGLSKVYESQGDYDKALGVIQDALHSSSGTAEVLARQAQLLHLRGRWDEADEAVTAALKIRPDLMLAHWVRGEILRDRGEPEKADGEFSAIVRIYSERSEHDDDIKDPDELLIAGLAGCEHARWSRQPDQFSFVLNDVYADALKYDSDFWPAEYESGRLLLDKYNRGEALVSFDKALAINPRAAEVVAAKGRVAFGKMNFVKAQRQAARALSINPSLPDALRLAADVHLAAGETEEALKDLELAKNVNPRDEEALARLASCYSLRHYTAGYDAILKQVNAQDRRPGLFHFAVAEQLADRQRFDEAAMHYREAIAVRPDLAAPRAGLGFLEMRLGREPEATALLDRAFELDPFNVRVSNARKVLHHLRKYQTIKTPHFELRFDPQHDNRLAHYMSGYLERIYVELSRDFAYKPKGPFLVELFDSHEMFSGRTISLPDLHTIGACTGRVVALCSPHARGIAQPFNWARVLRHETVHLFNLDQTDFLTPHWLTEGLAVGHEGFPRPQPWNEVLGKHIASGDLFTLANIDLGFIRPRSPEEWTLAYAQGQLYVDFLKARYGAASIGRLLDAYRDGLDTPAAIRRVCGVGKDQFERRYREFIAKVVPKIACGPVSDARTLEQLAKAHAADPANNDVAAALATRDFEHGRQAEARKLVDEILQRSPGHATAAWVKARLLLGAGEDEAARKTLEAVPNPASPDPRVAELLGRLYEEAKDFMKAAACYEQMHKAQPYEYKWLAGMVRLYASSRQREKLVAALKEVILADPDDLRSRRSLADVLLGMGRFDEAAKYAREALEIDFVDEESERTLGDALLAQKKYDPAIEAYATALETNGSAVDTRLQLAKAYLESGRKPEAQKEVATVLTAEPQNAEGKRLQALLDK